MNAAASVATSLQTSAFWRLPLFRLAAAFIAGIFLASIVSVPWYIWLVPALLLAVIVLLLRKPSSSLPRFVRGLQASVPLLGVLCIVVLLGAARYQASVRPITPLHVAFYNDREYEVLATGFIANAPDERDTYTGLQLDVESIDTGDGDVPAHGRLLAWVDINRKYEYGQEIRLRGHMQTPPEDEDFSYREYLARHGMNGIMPDAEATVLPGRRANPLRAALYAVRNASLARIYRLLPDPEASLLAGIVLGVDTGLTQELQDAFRLTGTAHIIAISGFNMAILSGLLVRLSARLLGPLRGGLVALLGILFYTLFVGAAPSVSRAAFMSGLALFAPLLGRKIFGMYTLTLAAAFLALLNPFVLWDVGFQLSFFATLGIVLYAAPLTSLLSARLPRLPWTVAVAGLLPSLADLVLIPVVAQFATLPLTAYYFQRLSLISIPANLLIGAVQAPVMIGGALAAFSGLLLPPLGQLFAFAAWPFACYTIRIVEAARNLHAGTIFLDPTDRTWPVLAGGLVLAVTFTWPWLKDRLTIGWRRARHLAAAALLVSVLMCAVLAWRQALTSGDGRLHLTFLDVGSADGVLIQTPRGRNILINGGPSAAALSDQLGRRLPILRRKLDWLVVAATAEDQLAALPRVLDRYPPQQVLWGGNMQASYASRQVDVWLADRGVPITYAQAGQRLILGEEVYLEVAATGPRGSVLVLAWRNFRAVLPMGVDADTIAGLGFGDGLEDADVLLLADSGYPASNPLSWITNLDPTLVVISVAAGDIEGRPSQLMLETLSGFPHLRTDRNGWISIATDGEEMSVQVERLAPLPAGIETPSHPQTPSPLPSATVAPNLVPNAGGTTTR